VFVTEKILLITKKALSGMQKMLSLTEEIFSFAVRIFCLMEKVFSFATRIFCMTESIFSFSNMMLSVVGKTLYLPQNIFAKIQAKPTVAAKMLAVAQMIF